MRVPKVSTINENSKDRILSDQSHFEAAKDETRTLKKSLC